MIYKLHKLKKHLKKKEERDREPSGLGVHPLVSHETAELDMSFTISH